MHSHEIVGNNTHSEQRAVTRPFPSREAKHAPNQRSLDRKPLSTQAVNDSLLYLAAPRPPILGGRRREGGVWSRYPIYRINLTLTLTRYTQIIFALDNGLRLFTERVRQPQHNQQPQVLSKVAWKDKYCEMGSLDPPGLSSSCSPFKSEPLGLTGTAATPYDSFRKTPDGST